MSLPQGGPWAFERVELWKVGRQRHQGDVGRHALVEHAGAAGLVQHHGGVLVGGKLLMQLFEGHGHGGDDGHDQGEAVTGRVPPVS